jgi:hypothetical protein
VKGRLGLDTFVRRVDDAYGAKTAEELARLTGDLPPRESWWQRLLATFAGTKRPRVEPSATILRPPDVALGDALTLGRSSESDYLVPEATVSAKHAELRRTADGWWIRDLGSLNGTRVNGWRVTEQRVYDGDQLVLGSATLVFRDPRS